MLHATSVSCSVVIKGSEGDEAVLCTGSLTYALKYVETTNLQLLVDPSAEVGCNQEMCLEWACSWHRQQPRAQHDTLFHATAQQGTCIPLCPCRPTLA